MVCVLKLSFRYNFLLEWSIGNIFEALQRKSSESFVGDLYFLFLF